MINQLFPSIVNEFSENGYEVIMVSYLKRNELLTPFFKHNHVLINYKIRKNKWTIEPERTIINSAFKSLDQYTEGKSHPLCVIIHLPPKSKYRLEKKGVKIKNFEHQRDFALANLYHEVHKRKYFFPNRFIIYPSFDSKTAIFIEN